MKRSLSILVHAYSKVGKSTLGASVPRPMLIIDAEGGTKFLANSPWLTAKLGHPLNLVQWEPSQAPPDVTGIDGAVVTIHTWEQVKQVTAWLQSHQHPFRGLVVDSITEVQRRLKRHLKGDEQMMIADWGSLLTKMDGEIRGLRDLANNPHSPVEVAVFIAESRMNGAKLVPYMQGQIAVSLPYAVDICGYLYVENELDDATGQPTRPVRKLLVTPHPQYEAGERVQGAVGPIISQPDVEAILDAVYPHAAKEAAPV